MSKNRLILRFVSVSVLLGTGLGIALAQDETPSAPGEAVAEVRQPANLGPQDQLAEARRIVAGGASIGQRVTAELDVARREGDIIHVTCLNDKLTQINANLRTAEGRMTALTDAINANDSARANHEFTVLTVLSQKFMSLEQEANQCVGQDTFETGSTRVTTTVDPGTPGGEGGMEPDLDQPLEAPPPETLAGVILSAGT